MSYRADYSGSFGMEKDMKVLEKWNRFEQTGHIADYLEYCGTSISSTGDSSLEGKDRFHMNNRTGEQHGNRTGNGDGNGTDSVTGERVR